ncbi:hypothetical protein [Pseudomonas sp.]|uniref:hypothetical protein n=1 Tax=Pseudomonas sp. TaxID=306 RepID=UPI00299E2461|nr:hypothetical protein [Pseudomonas sp.]MDX1370124.1 hypothetical protein [Pseudomonas sp.]
MANGIRQPAGLRELAALMFEEGFAGGILPFDTDAAVRYAGLAAESEVKGKVVDMADGQIAASPLCMMCESLRAMLAFSTTWALP